MRLPILAATLATVLAFAGPAAAYPVAQPTHSAQVHPGYPLYATFCAAGTLIIDSWYVGYTQHRELTSEEAIGMTATCFFPPLALYYLAKHANEPAPAPVPVVKHRRHHH
jgi:hypothetical protein